MYAEKFALMLIIFKLKLSYLSSKSNFMFPILCRGQGNLAFMETPLKKLALPANFNFNS